MGYGPPQVVEGQPRVGLPFGLFSVLSLRESSDPHWANGIEWEAMTCYPASGIEDPDCVTPMDMFFRDMNEIGSATPFVVYGSAKCGTPGGAAFQRAEENAQAHLLAREEAQAEASVWAKLQAGATVLNGGAVKPAQALGLLEDWMGETYGSLGVIHGRRSAVTALNTSADHVHTSGSKLVTTLGTPVVAGAGYAGGPPAAGSAWLIASPALFGYRGQVFTSKTLDHAHNDMYAIAERNYVVGYDPCGVAAVMVDITG